MLRQIESSKNKIKKEKKKIKTPKIYVVRQSLPTSTGETRRIHYSPWKIVKIYKESFKR